MIADVDRILDALVELGIDEGFPRERQKLANGLLADGATTEQIAIVAAWAARQKPKSLPGLIKVTLADRERRAEVLADVALVASRRAGEAEAEAKPFQFGQGDWSATSSPDQWDECDRARRVAARVDGDRREIGSVAVEFRLSIDETERLLALGRELRPRLAGPALRAEESHEERTKRFVDAMRNSRRSL